MAKREEARWKREYRASVRGMSPAQIWEDHKVFSKEWSWGGDYPDPVAFRLGVLEEALDNHFYPREPQFP